VQVQVVRGNHDRHAGDAPADLGFEPVEEPFPDGPFRLKHFPDPEPDGYVLAGHLHPAVQLRGGGERLRLPCFYFGARVGILPSFGALTGSATVRPRMGDRVFVVADGEVLEV
jgi:metallophosphoesterase superfamily enzyme